MSWSTFPASEFNNFCDQWQMLNMANCNSPLLHPDFIAPALQAFGEGDEILAIDGPINAPNAMGIFSSSGRFSWQSFQPSVAPLGAWVQKPETSLQDLLDGLCRALPGFNLLIAISQQDPKLAPRPPHDKKTKTLDYITTACVPINGDFEGFWKSLSKNLRHNTKRQRRRLASEGIVTRFELITDPSKVADAVESYAKIESSGWKGKLGTAVGVGDNQSQFYTQMLEKFCLHKNGIIFRYWYDDKLVATNLCIHNDDILIILKTTYDESENRTSPAQLLRQEVLKLLFDEARFHALEFYGPIGDWHRRLTNQYRTMYHVNRYRWQCIAAAHGK